MIKTTETTETTDTADTADTTETILIWRVSLLGVDESITKAGGPLTTQPFKVDNHGGQVSVGFVETTLEIRLRSLLSTEKWSQCHPRVFLEWSLSTASSLTFKTSHTLSETAQVDVALSQEAADKYAHSALFQSLLETNCPLPTTPSVSEVPKSGREKTDQSAREFQEPCVASATEHSRASNWSGNEHTPSRSTSVTESDDADAPGIGEQGQKLMSRGGWPRTDGEAAYKHHQPRFEKGAVSTTLASMQNGLNDTRQDLYILLRPSMTMQGENDTRFRDLDPSVFWTWHGPTSTWQHVDSDTGSIIICPDDVD